MSSLRLVHSLDPGQASGPLKNTRVPPETPRARVMESPRELGLVGAQFLKHVAQAFHRVGSVESQVDSVAARLHSLEQLFVRSRPASDEERTRWAGYLVAVTSNPDLPEAQRAAIMDIWQRIIEREPTVMYPTSGFDEDRTFYFGWNPPGRTLDVQIGANGEVSWLFADHTTKFSASSDEHDSQAFLTFMSSFLRRA